MYLRKFVTVMAIMAVTWSVNAGDFEIDDFFMRDVEDVNDSLTNNLNLNNEKASYEDVIRLAEMLSKVETYYSIKDNAEEQYSLAIKSQRLTKEIKHHIELSELNNAAKKASELSRTCKACHDYK